MRTGLTPPLVLKPAWAWSSKQNHSAKLVEVAKQARAGVQRAAVQGSECYQCSLSQGHWVPFSRWSDFSRLCWLSQLHGRDTKLLLPVVSCYCMCSCGGFWYFDIIFSSGKEDEFLSLIYPRCSQRFSLFLRAIPFLLWSHRCNKSRLPPCSQVLFPLD